MDHAKGEDIIPLPERVLPRLIYHRRQVRLLEKQLKLSRLKEEFVDVDRDDAATPSPDAVST